ncbi:MAG: pyruvate kinase [Rhodospirillales bacterium]|nr:pyruvate kinase [Rhodospirillales bacterium]
MRRTRSAKILATLGPASSSRERISELFEAGADVFRLNFSHGSYGDHKARYDIIRELEEHYQRPIGILMDLQGPKIRVGNFKDGPVRLVGGGKFRLDLSDAPGDASRAPMPHPEVFAALKEGSRLFLDDGKIVLRTEKCSKDHVETVVVSGGMLSDHKGVNVPDVVLPLSAMTEKDYQDLEFGLNLGVDWVALSFVQTADDVAHLRGLISGQAGVLAKLEKPSALVHLDAILEQSDAVMVARGDLGVEVPPEDVPSLQKRIIRACRAAGKPVVVATQMLDSMVHAPTPTRAEASDVATAIYDGADAVMLSAETAAGDYPVEAVSMMNRIIERVENDELYRRLIEAEGTVPRATTADAITAAATQVASTLSAAAIVTFTKTGSTALRAARIRPDVPILCLTPNPMIARRMALAWDIHAVRTKEIGSFSEMVQKAIRLATREGFSGAGDRLVITAGVPFGTPGATNVLRVVQVDSEEG